MTNQTTEDGSLWPRPLASARRRRLRTLLIVVCVTIAVVLVVLQLIAQIHPHTVTNHAQRDIGDVAAGGTLAYTNLRLPSMVSFSLDPPRKWSEGVWRNGADGP